MDNSSYSERMIFYVSTFPNAVISSSIYEVNLMNL